MPTSSTKRATEVPRGDAERVGTALDASADAAMAGALLSPGP
jgi:hypothetical protein